MKNPSMYTEKYLRKNLSRGVGYGLTVGSFLAGELKGTAKKYGAGYQRALVKDLESEVKAGRAFKSKSHSGGVAYYPERVANPTKKIRVPARDLAKTKAYITQDDKHNYVLVSETGARFSLSVADAIRSQKSGVPYKATSRNGAKRIRVTDTTIRTWHDVSPKFWKSLTDRQRGELRSEYFKATNR